MKLKYLLGSLAIVVITAFSACKKAGFLDKKAETLTEDKVFADSALTSALITDMYAYTGQDVIPARYTMITTPVNNEYGCLDDQTTLSMGYWDDPTKSVMQGTYTAANYAFNNYWTTYYKKIRQASLFMQKAVNSPISAARKKRLMAEAKYLRAFFYIGLIRFYGGVQIMPNEPLDVQDPLISKRNTYKECVDYVVAELDAAATDLPAASAQDASEYGHATKGAALALKARILLTAASPLFNGNSFSSDASILPYITYSTSYNSLLWQKAADALKAVIDMPDYSLVIDNTTRAGHGFWKMFLKGRRNTELITPYFWSGSALETYRFPRSRNGSGGYNNPSENAVAYFGMKNGKSITDPTSGYNPANPYTNREPRFYYSIIYNQAPIWKSGSGTTMVPIDIYFNKATGAMTADGIQAYYTRTGYYSRKMCNDSIAPGGVTNSNRAYPVIRLAEMVMGYAEALNEMGQTEQAVTNLIKLRSRAGIDPGSDNRYGIAAGISQSDLRKVIQADYVAEFFQEGLFWYNTRRWRTAEVTEKMNTTSMLATRETNGTYTYTAGNAVVVNWQQRAYFAPIPQSEINKAATLIQNPGW
ncbi:RagB/SusD family nutrient uptake outer membrane protein [Pedobacter nototheniae]|uniref:RagB/SusD family nutrient uptake outer membrane protein n=1 Tax=Pedobacter nototheniae TaxID=2488994 RepID=UPI00103FE103|nr:RagB/SusD family nutrient uptake outer membrane protein [Pedobacter nototheniae]